MKFNPFKLIGIFVAVIVLLVVVNSVWDHVYVKPNYCLVVVKTVGGSQGTQETTLGPGHHWLMWNERGYDWPTFTINKNYTLDATGHDDSPVDEAIRFQLGKVLCNVDVKAAFSVPRQTAPKVFVKYNKGIDEIRDIVIRSFIRDGFMKYGPFMTLDSGMVAGKGILQDSVKTYVQRSAAQIGITVDDVAMISEIRPPKEISATIAEANKANQIADRKQNELRQAVADAQKVIAKAKGDSAAKVIEASGEAEAFRRKVASLGGNAGFVVRMAEIEMMKSTWNGTYPTVLQGSGGGSILNLPELPMAAAASKKK